MDSFKKNKIFLDKETVAEQLRSARQEKKLKLDQVAKRLGIKLKYLDALEKGEYNKLPKGIYGMNYLKEYVLFLGLEYEELKKDYLSEKSTYDPQQEKEIFSKQIVKKKYLMAMPKSIKNLIICLIAIICFTYFGYRLNKIISPPYLYVESPAENLITTEHAIEVRGKTEPEAKLVINGEPILGDTKGDFIKTVNLKEGVNIITITANKKYSRNNTIIRQVLVNERKE